MLREYGCRWVHRIATVALSLLFALPTSLHSAAAEQSRLLVVGSETDFPPYAFIDKQGNPAGYSIDLIRGAAAEMGLGVQIKTGSWNWAWQALKDGEVDLLPVVARLPGRDREVDFSVIHTSADDAFFTRTGDAEIRSIAAAKGKEVVVMRSDAAHHALVERGFKGRIVTVETIPEGLRLVASGRHDAFLCSKLIGVMVVQEQAIGGIGPGAAIGEYRRDFSFAVKKGTRRELLDQLNQGLLILQANGEYQKIHERWLSLADPWYVAYRNQLVLAAGLVAALALAAAAWSVLLKRQVAAKTAEVNDLYQNAPCGYHSIDASGLIRRINDTELRWLGYARDEVVDKLRITDLMTAASRGAFTRDYPRFAASGEIHDLEYEFVRKDGSVMPVLVSATSIRDSHGGIAASRTVVLDMTERKKLEEAQRENSRRSEGLSRRIVAVQEKERRQLALTLHDETSPNLAAIGLVHQRLRELLGQNSDPEILATLDDAKALIQDTTAGIRQMSADMRPTLLDYGGLGPALNEYARQFGRRTGIRVEVNVGIEERPPEEAESALFRIAQEALTNCMKHAKANTVAISLADGDGRTTLTIADDGIGLDANRFGQEGFTPGHGLLSMRERAEFVGGQFQIESRPGEGTRIQVRLGS